MVKNRALKTIIYFIFLLASTSTLAFQLSVSEDHPFGLYYDEETVLVAENGKVRTEFLFEIPDQYYLYREKFKIRLETPDVNAKMDLPDAETKYDEFLAKETRLYYNQLILPVAFHFTDPSHLPDTIVGTLIYQGCSGKICFRAMRQPFVFRVKAQGMREMSDASPPLSSDFSKVQQASWSDHLKPARFEDVLARGLLFSMAMTFLAGLLTGFTPCVLPVIPLTLTFMGVSRQQRSGQKIVSLLVFVLGLVMMYSTLGVLSALLGKTLGFWFQSLIFQIFLVVFFLLMGLWMLGALQFNVPAAWQTGLARYHPKGHLAQLYAGLTVGFLAAPCVGPIIGPLLVYISVSRDVVFGFVLMLSFALGLSVLFFMLGFFSQNWVRRFGEKSQWLKKVLGTFLLVTAALYLWWIIKPHLGFNDGFFLDSLAVAEQKARENNKGVLVDFYADWCLPCHQWDRVVWSDEGVREKVLVDFVPVKIDCSQDSGECEEASRRFQIIGMPSVIFLDRRLEEIRTSRIIGGEMSAGEFLNHLQKAKH